jgi:outer membrane protein assembly factor BamB
LGGGVAPDPGFKIADDFGKARLVWTSEDQIPYGYETRGGWQGGYASPIVADGRVYLGYVRPHGREVFDMTEDDKKDLGGDNQRKMTLSAPWRLQHGDDVIHCFDAATGRTLWRFVDEQGLMNRCESGHFTCCVHAGRICMFGSTGRLYCVDAASGKLAWAVFLNEKNRDAFDRSRAAGKSVFNLENFNNTPSAVDGVVAISAGGARGFDVESGKELWTVKVSGKRMIPVLWRHANKTYFVAGNTCIEPRTGKVLWQIPDASIGETTAACVHGDYYVCTHLDGVIADGEKKGKTGHVAGSTCFRVTPEKFEKLWSLPEKRHTSMGCTDVICGGYFLQASDDDKPANTLVVELATGKVVATIPDTFRTLGYSPLSCQGMVFGGLYGISLWRIAPGDFRVVFKGKKEHWSVGCSPALVGTRLYFRTKDRLVCYDLRAP